MDKENNILPIVRQCKDVPDKPILEFLNKRRMEGKTPSFSFSGFESSIDQAMPKGAPEKIVIKKMYILIKRGLVGGCGCGCRGDFVITQKGIEWLNNQNIKD